MEKEKFKVEKVRNLLISYIEGKEDTIGDNITAVFDYLEEIVSKDLKNLELSDLIRDNSIFLLISSILSRYEYMKNSDVLKECYNFMRNFHRRYNKIDNEKDIISIVATGGEKEIRTPIITLIIGIITSMYYPTIIQGNRSVTGCFCGHCAETDIMEELGYNVNLEFEALLHKLRSDKFAYFNAQVFHPLLYRFADVRGFVGFRDIWKLVACIADPINARWRYVAMWTYDYIQPLFDMIKEVNELQDRMFMFVSNNKIDEYIGGKYYIIAHTKEERTLKEKTLELEEIEDLYIDDLKKIIKRKNFREEVETLSTIIKNILYNNKNTKNEEKIIKEISVLNAAIILKEISDYKHENRNIKDLIEEINQKIREGIAKKQFEKIFKKELE